MLTGLLRVCVCVSLHCGQIVSINTAEAALKTQISLYNSPNIMQIIYDFSHYLQISSLSVNSCEAKQLRCFHDKVNTTCRKLCAWHHATKTTHFLARHKPPPPFSQISWASSASDQAFILHSKSRFTVFSVANLKLLPDEAQSPVTTSEHCDRICLDWGVASAGMSHRSPKMLQNLNKDTKTALENSISID